MNLRSVRLAAPAAVLSLAFALSACGGGTTTGAGTPSPSASTGATGAALSGEVNGAGASSQQAAMQAWIAGFTADHPDVTINYDPSGSGAGRDQFTAGAVNFAGSDAYLDDAELAKAAQVCGGRDNVIELPTYISPIAIIFNLPGINQLKMSPDVIAGIFKQDITKWNDPAIAKLNPGVTLPGTAITPVNRSDESGTTENFTDYLSQAAPKVWTYEASGNWPVKGGEAAQGTSGVVNAVKNGQGAIGYADASQAGSLGTVAVQVGDKFLVHTPQAAAAIVDAATPVSGRGTHDFAVNLDRTPDTGAYPVVLLSYELACTQYSDAQTAAIVKAFLGYLISPQGQQAAAQAAGSAPISESVRVRAQKAVDAISAA